MTAAVALLQCRRRSAWLLESSWSVFLLLGWILIRRGFLPFRLSPRAHIHTHTHKTSCVYGLSRPRPFATLISLVRRDSAHPKRENSPSRKRERESLELLLVAESRVRRHQTFVAIRCAPFRVSKKHLQLLLDLSWETSVSECFSDNWNFVCVCSVDIRIFILTVITTLKG